MKNKRSHVRYKIFMSPLRCSRCDSKDIKVDVSDISCGGMRISTNEKLSAGKKIELELNIPGDDIPMFVGGEVAWVARDKDDEGSYNAGIKFTRINYCDTERLAKYIQSSFGVQDMDLPPEL